MRALPVLAVAAVAVSALGGGTRSTPLVASAGATPAAVLAASYPFHLKFDVTYRIEWREPQGLDGRDADPMCASWRIDRGVTTVIVKDAPWKRRGQRRARRHGIPGQLLMPGRPPTNYWASAAAVGRARGTVHRRWVQSGGPYPECPNVEPWRRTPADCGERRLTTRTASVVAQERRHLRTLDDLTTVAGMSRPANTEVLSFTIAPASALYRSCMMSPYAPEYPVNLGVRVALQEAFELENVEPGGTVTGELTRSGICDDDLSDDSECTFRLDVDWTLTRWKPGTPFP